MTHARIVHLAGRLTALANQRIAARLEREGLSGLLPAHGDLLVHLFTEEALTVSELARRTHRTKSTVSVLAGKLERLGYLERRRREDDQRALAVSLTEQGRALERVFEEVSQDLDARLSASLTEEQRRQLEALLERTMNAF
ncbi:MAG: MarR family winged helix-turn-helix transcriptional regulator [Duodenibacillus sp.]